MNFAIVDDEDIQLDGMKALISAELRTNFPNTTHRVDLYHSGDLFLKHWTPGQYDVVVLDIFMGGTNGVDVAGKIRETDTNVKLVFCSRSNEFAAESYQVNAHYYLIKPATAGSVSNMFRRLALDHHETEKTVTLPDGHSIPARSIIYTEYYNHVVTIHFKGGTTYRIRTSNGQMEEILLDAGGFCCPNKGIIVNLYEADSIHDEFFLMSDGTNLPISRRKSKEIRNEFTKFQFQKMRKEVMV